jgi:serine/threonine protein kinase/predicted Zn-dependent protease
MHGQDGSLLHSAIPPSAADFVNTGPSDSWSAAPTTCGGNPALLPQAVFHPLPEVGGTFLGFELIAELGRGSFGRVFLGRQSDLAGRLVALKVSTEIVAESQKLAQLQHTHIVPVYSLHQAGPLQAAVMPYYGSTTLADILNAFHDNASVPATGRGLVRTLEAKKETTRASISKLRGPSSSSQPPAGPAPKPPEASNNLRRLEGLTYVEAALWLGSCLADGLAHAHDRGILHRDLKPANVLLTDDGQPMLLDFNLADDTKEGGPPRVGGTLAYMAPEHLAAFAGVEGAASPDARADVFSLGVILFELLTGKHPFPRVQGPLEQVIPAMLEARQCPYPRPSQLNPAISPSVESILRKCLAPCPSRRYQSAAHLREDIQCHLDNLPLRHAPEPSATELFRKWSRRNPRLVSASTLCTLALLMVAALVFLLVSRGQRLNRLDALSEYAEFQNDLQAARLALAAPLPDDPNRAEGERLARRALGRYGVLVGPDWRDRASWLPPAHREALEAEVGELLLLLAGEPAPEEGLRLNEMAERCYSPCSVPRSVYEQRARLLGQLGKTEEAKEALRLARQRELAGPTDRFLMARELAARSLHADAARVLRRVVEEEPNHFAAWFLLGCCALEMGADSAHEAAACFTACVALRPEVYAAWQNRGLALLRLARWAEAERDLTRALAQPSCPPMALLLRARARLGLGKPREALADLDACLRRNGPRTRALLARAQARLALGDAVGARRDTADAIASTPTDEEGWIARGVARVRTDPGGALGDFGNALVHSPRSVVAWQNRAHVLAEHLQLHREAIDALNHALELSATNVPARVGRAVLHARLGQRKQALDDLRLVLKAAPRDPEVLYQAGCIHALLSSRDAAGKRLALTYLARALQLGFGHEELAGDRDLANVRGEPGFADLLRCARTLHEASRRPSNR